MPATSTLVHSESRKRRRTEERRPDHAPKSPEELVLNLSGSSSASTTRQGREAPLTVTAGPSTPKTQRMGLVSRDSGYSSPGSRVREPDWNQTPSQVTGVDRIRQPDEPSPGDGEDDKADSATEVSILSTRDKAPGPSAVDDEIIEEIEKQLTKTDRAKKVGIPYTWLISRGESAAPMIKIGSTKRTIRKRKGNEMGSHRAWQYEEAPEMDWTAMRYYRRTERLAQKELAYFGNYTREKCELCTKHHREYFCGVDSRVAVAAVERWRRFCAAEPYDRETGELKPFWRNRLDQQRSGGFGTDPGEAPGDYVRCAKRWDRFVDATWLDHLWYDAQCLLDAVGGSSLAWCACSIAQALSFLLLPDIFTRFLSGLVILCLCNMIWNKLGCAVRWLYELANSVAAYRAGKRTDELLSPPSWFITTIRKGRIGFPDKYLCNTHDIRGRLLWGMNMSWLWEGFLRSFKTGRRYALQNLWSGVDEDGE